jgi:hypothetical protein
MPNYYGKSPLRMECPQCGKRGEHPVTRTDPATYHWSKELTPLFVRIAGRDISYRMRTKHCAGCSREFTTVEMADVFLRALVGEVERLSAESRNMNELLEAARSEIARLKEISAAASDVLKKA